MSELLRRQERWQRPKWRKKLRSGACGGGEQKKAVGVPEVTLGQGFGWGHYPFEEYWDFTGLRV